MSKKDEALKLVAERVLKAWDDPQGMPALCEEMNCLREALAEQPAQQGPVALARMRRFREISHWNRAQAEPPITVTKELWVAEQLEQFYTPPPASKPWVGPTDEQITAGARALCKQMAEACGVDVRDQWQLYSDTFKEDAKAVLEAAAKLREKNA